MSNADRLCQQFEAFATRDLDTVVDLYADDATIVDHALGETVTGPQGAREKVRQQLAFSSDQKFEITKAIDAGEWAIVYGVIRGTHDGPFAGIEATGETVEVDFCNLVRFNDEGKAIEDRAYYDLYSTLLQMGAVEPMG